MIDIASLYPEELADLLKQWGEPAFRAKQLFAWLQRGATPQEMTNIPQRLRERLSAQTVTSPVGIAQSLVSAKDGTVKLLFSLPDGHVVEGVLMHYHHGHTLCLSTQVGCRMGCLFCASTLEGCIRNLTASQMLGQVWSAGRCLVQQGEASAAGEVPRVHNLVLMGSGEPLDNYDEVIRFLRLVRHPEGVGIGLRNISLSTCGLVPEMRRFADEGLPVTLSLSLHAPNDAIRQRIMPIAKAYPLAAVMDACRYYVKQTGRRVILEYALIHGVNCEVTHAVELAGLLRGLQCHVNLIPLNDVPERELRAATRPEIEAFQRTLEGLNISVTRRREMGQDIAGACGQLRRRHLDNKEVMP